MARRRLIEADQLDVHHAGVLERRRWLLDGERPGPLLSAQLKRPPGAESVAALRVANQPLVTDPRRMAEVMIQHLAGISAGRPCDTAAQSQVLQSIEPTRRLGPQEASLLDNLTISEAEVLRALARARPGTSPGPDGLPMGFVEEISGPVCSTSRVAVQRNSGWGRFTFWIQQWPCYCPI